MSEAEMILQKQFETKVKVKKILGHGASGMVLLIELQNKEEVIKLIDLVTG